VTGSVRSTCRAPTVDRPPYRRAAGPPAGHASEPPTAFRPLVAAATEGPVALRPRTARRPGGQQPHRPDAPPNLRPPSARSLLLRPETCRAPADRPPSRRAAAPPAERAPEPPTAFCPLVAAATEGPASATATAWQAVSRCESTVNRRSPLHFSASNDKHLVSKMLDVIRGRRIAVCSADWQGWFTLCLQWGSFSRNGYVIGDQQLAVSSDCRQDVWRGLC